MKKIILIAIVVLLTVDCFSQAPKWLWAKGIGGLADDIAYSSALDAVGNIYTFGAFGGIVDFDPSQASFNLTGGSQDIFILKLDGYGNFVWAKRVGGINDDYGTSITLDASGDIYLTGGFSGTVDFDPGIGVFNITSVSNEDIFILKLDNSGNFIWVKTMGGTGYDGGESISVDNSGNVYTLGCFTDTVDFNPGFGIYNLTADSLGLFDIFILKLNSSGDFVWARSMGGNSSDYVASIVADNTGSGYLYITGWFRGTIDFDPGVGTFNLTSVGYDDVFISKLDDFGNFIWVKQFGGAYSDYGESLALDGSGNIYSTGWFSGTVDFDPGTGINNITGAGDYDIFISKLDASGNFVWARAMGGTNTDVATSIKTDTSGNIYIAGYFNGTTDFNPGVGTFNLTSAGMNDIFISKLDGSGNFLYAKSMGGTSYDGFPCITMDASGNGFLTGIFQSPSICFDSDTLINADNTSNNYDLFIAKLDTSSNVGITEKQNVQSTITIYPNPFNLKTNITFNEEQKQSSIKIMDVLGKEIKTIIFSGNQLTIEKDEMKAGIYFVQITDQNKNIINRKMVLW